MRIEPVPYEKLDPELKRRYEAGKAEGRYTMTAPLQAYAYATNIAAATDEWYRRTFKQTLLGPRLEELLRIRSAQLNGCAPCSQSRKDESISADDVACMLTDLNDSKYTERERRALRFLQLLCTDHHAIDDDVFRSLGEVFTTAEIVELGLYCANMLGMHRWNHALDIFGTSKPVIRYVTGQVNAIGEEQAVSKAG